MDRIQFEDGRKISNAKVTIQEQDYEVIPALYEGSTPLSASVLNQLQENIEHAITEAILEDNKKK